MCGGFLIFSKFKELEDRFDAETPVGDFRPRYNARPTQRLPVILNTTPHQIELDEWGIIPPWSKSRRIINTRKESLDMKDFYKRSFREKRCLVLTNGFYEWGIVDGKKVPFLYSLSTNEPFAYAGLWQENKKSKQPNFTIITVDANELVRKIHNRMPAILPLYQEKEWLDPDLSEKQALEMLSSFPVSKMKVSEASARVNFARFDDPELLNPDPRTAQMF